MFDAIFLWQIKFIFGTTSRETTLKSFKQQCPTKIFIMLISQFIHIINIWYQHKTYYFCFPCLELFQLSISLAKADISLNVLKQLFLNFLPSFPSSQTSYSLPRATVWEPVLLSFMVFLLNVIVSSVLCYIMMFKQLCGQTASWQLWLGPRSYFLCSVLLHLERNLVSNLEVSNLVVVTLQHKL